MELKVVLKDQAPHALPHGAFCRMTLKIAAPCVKATSCSSTARPQEIGHHLSRHGRAVPGILMASTEKKTWMAGTSPAMTTDGMMGLRDKRKAQAQCPG